MIMIVNVFFVNRHIPKDSISWLYSQPQRKSFTNWERIYYGWGNVFGVYVFYICIFVWHGLKPALVVRETLGTSKLKNNFNFDVELRI